MGIFKISLLFTSVMSWILSLGIGAYSIYLCFDSHSFKPILVLVSFIIIAHVIGFIFYQIFGFTQLPILLLINKIFYKEEKEDFLEKRMLDEIGIGFWVASFFFLIRSIIIFTFNFFIDQGTLGNYNYNFIMIFLIGFAWAIAIHEGNANSFSNLFSSVICPLFYCCLFANNILIPYIFKDIGYSNFVFINIISMLII